MSEILRQKPYLHGSDIFKLEQKIKAGEINEEELLRVLATFEAAHIPITSDVIQSLALRVLDTPKEMVEATETFSLSEHVSIFKKTSNKVSFLIKDEEITFTWQKAQFLSLLLDNLFKVVTLDEIFRHLFPESCAQFSKHPELKKASDFHLKNIVAQIRRELDTALKKHNLSLKANEIILTVRHKGVQLGEDTNIDEAILHEDVMSVGEMVVHYLPQLLELRLGEHSQRITPQEGVLLELLLYKNTVSAADVARAVNQSRPERKKRGVDNGLPMRLKKKMALLIAQSLMLNPDEVYTLISKIITQKDYHFVFDPDFTLT